MNLVTEIYRATKAFPAEERYGLTNQVRRAAVSVPSNIAEGQARFSGKEFYRFLGVARGSLVEMETQIEIAKNLGYLSRMQGAELLKSTAELGRILSGLLADQSGCLARFSRTHFHWDETGHCNGLDLS